MVLIAVLLLLLCVRATVPDDVSAPVVQWLAAVAEPAQPYELAVHRAQRAYLTEWISRTVQNQGRYITVRQTLRPELAAALETHGFTIVRIEGVTQVIVFPSPEVVVAPPVEKKTEEVVQDEKEML